MSIEHPKCQYCGQDATRLYFYSKTYSDSGKDTIESPILTCEECSSKARKDLSIDRGGIQRIHCKTFKDIARMTEKQIGWFCSKKGKEVNHLANKPWRKLLFRIHYISLSPKKEPKQNRVSP